MSTIPAPSEWADKNKRTNRAKASEKATEGQWMLVDEAIKAFIARFPYHWMHFRSSLNAGRTEYAEATSGELKKSQYRHTASFPVFKSIDPKTNEWREDALLPVLEKYIPGLTHKNSKNYAEFLRRYPIFMPSDKTNTSQFN